MNTPKQEALDGLSAALKTLRRESPIDGLTRHQLLATLEFVDAAVLRIQELKRPRRAKKEPLIIREKTMSAREVLEQFGNPDAEKEGT